MSAFSVDTGWQTTPPLIDGVVHQRPLPGVCFMDPVDRNRFRKSSTPRLLHFLFGNSLINSVCLCIYSSNSQRWQQLYLHKFWLSRGLTISVYEYVVKKNIIVFLYHRLLVDLWSKLHCCWSNKGVGKNFTRGRVRGMVQADRDGPGPRARTLQYDTVDLVGQHRRQSLGTTTRPLCSLVSGAGQEDLTTHGEGTSAVYAILTSSQYYHNISQGDRCSLWCFHYAYNTSPWLGLFTAPNNRRREASRLLVVRRCSLSVGPSFARWFSLISYFAISPHLVKAV